MANLARLAALPILVIAAFAAATYASLYWAGCLFPRVVPRPYVEMVSAAVVGAAAAAFVTAIPLAKLYGRHAWLGGLVVAAPWIALRTSDLLHYWDRSEPRIIVMSFVELLLFPAVIIGVAQLALVRFGPRPSKTQ